MSADTHPSRKAGGLYETHVPAPSPWKERLLNGLPPILRLLRPSFRFDGRTYRYFLHPYNRTVRNERCVEIPIVLDWLERQRGRRILEVGHVLGHYGRVGHDVVDKYEAADRVIRTDIAAFAPSRPYDLILSVSTLEHVGWDEEPKEPEKIHAVLDRLRRVCLAPGGMLIATVPLGYNPYLDDALASGRLPFARVLYMRRLSKWAHWEECTAVEARVARYDDPFPCANGIAVGFLGGAR